MEIKKIAVIGAGTMGGGIAQTAAQAGYKVIMADIDDKRARGGFTIIRDRLEKRVASERLDSRDKDKVLSNIETSSRFADCEGAGLIIEAVTEKEEIKKDIFRKLDDLCPAETVFASNTSSISITRLAEVTKRPSRFIGMHFMNPAYVMKLVEIVRGLRTAEDTVIITKAVSERMGKTPVVVEDFPGFVSNRVLMPLINEAIFCLQEGVSSREGIDTVMRLGANHPMGPLELADFIGLDTCLEIMEILQSELGEKFRPCPLLRKMVAAGRLGKKGGEGFYEYR